MRSRSTAVNTQLKVLVEWTGYCVHLRAFLKQKVLSLLAFGKIL